MKVARWVELFKILPLVNEHDKRRAEKLLAAFVSLLESSSASSVLPMLQQIVPDVIYLATKPPDDESVLAAFGEKVRTRLAELRLGDQDSAGTV